MRTKQITRLFFLCLLIFGISHQDCLAQTQGDSDDPIVSVLRKPHLKILHIGNSYTFDAVSFLPSILNNNNVDISDLCIYRTMRAGGSFKMWYDIYHDNDHEYYYQIEKVCGGIDANISTGDGSVGDGSLFRKALTDEQWDIITIQQSSAYAPYYEQWGGQGPGGYLNELLGLIKQLQPHAVIGMMLVHSYASNYSGNVEQSSLERWKLIVSSVEKCCADYGIKLVIPYGTAIQNLRTSSLNNDADLTYDGVHCDYVLGRYTATCCYFETIIKPRTGISILGDKTRINTLWLPDPSSAVPVDENTAPIAQKAAILAVNDRQHCSNPEDNEATSIVSPHRQTATNDEEYTLTGLKVRTHSKGIYIKNGQKRLRD